MKIHSISFLLLLALLLFAGWGLFDSNDGNDSESTVITEKNISTLKTNVVNSAAAKKSPVASYSDGIYNYFCFKIGEIQNAPIYYENANAHEGIVDMNFKWEESTSVENKISQASTNCISNTVSAQLKASVQTSANGTVGAKPLSASASISAGLEASLSNSTTSSTTSSTTKSISNIVTTKHTTSFVLDKDCPQGYYRYTICADCDVYAIVRAKIGSEEKYFNYSYVTLSKGNFNEGIFYSPNSQFDSESEISLEFDTSLLDEIDLFADYLPLIEPTEMAEYTNYNEWTITDDGQWGLHNPDQTEKLNLYSLAPYMNSKYNIVFEITVNMEELFDGYQEILLYNKWNDWVDDTDNINSEIAESKYGVVAVKTITHGDAGAWDHEFTFTIDGSKCNEKMYIRYDAHGKYEDTWYRNNIRVTIKAVPKEQ